MKRFITGILLFILCGLLLGCRSDGADRPDSPAAATATISVAGYPSFQPAYERLIQQFQEEYPDIQVQFVPLAGQQANLSLREQATLADLILLEGQPPTADAAAAFLDLTLLLAGDPTFDAADFWPGIMDACRAAGVQVGLPFRANASLIFFDKTAFDAAGLLHPEPGWNWEDFQQTAQTLAMREGEETARYGFADGGNPLGLLAPLVDNIIRQAGDTLDGRRIAAELEWYVTLAHENVILSESGNPLQERQAAMWVSSQFGLAAARAALGDDLGVAAFPSAAGMSQSNPVTAGCALISAGTNHSQAAWTFLDYLSRQALFTTGIYPAAPARPSIAQSSGYWEGMGVETAVALRAALENGWYRRAEMPELATVGDALNQALTGGMTLAESLPGTVEIQPTAPPPTPDSEAVAVATPRVTPTLNPDAIVIEYDAMSHDDREAVILLAQAFNESQDRIRVNATTRLPFAAGTTIDLIDIAGEYDCFLSGFGSQYMADRHGDVFFEALYDLSPLFEAEEAAFQNDFMPALLEINQVNGALYALPVAVNPVVLRYNSDLLAQRGIAPPNADWTLEEFWALVQEAGSGSAYGLVAVETIYPDELLSFVPGAAFYFDLDTRPMQPKFTDPAVVGALTFLGEMAEASILYPNTPWASRRTWQEEMGSGQMLLVNTGRAAVWAHRVGAGAGDGGPRVAYGTVPYPQRALPNYFSQEGSGSGNALYISRRSPDPTACWEWFQFLFEHPHIFLGLPVRQSIRESAAWRESVGEQTAVAYETMYFRPQERLPDIGMAWEIWAYRTWWADALLSVYQGEDPSLALNEAQRRAEVFYDCYAPLDEPTFAQVQDCARQADPDFRK